MICSACVGHHGVVISAPLPNPACIAPHTCVLPPISCTSNWKERYLTSSAHISISPAPVTEADAHNDRPSELSRCARLTRHFMSKYWRDPGMFSYRNIAMTFFGFFIGTMFLLPGRETLELQLIAGALFFALWVRADAVAIRYEDRLVEEARDSAILSFPFISC